jgi:hypothetical protein
MNKAYLTICGFIALATVYGDELPTTEGLQKIVEQKAKQEAGKAPEFISKYELPSAKRAEEAIRNCFVKHYNGTLVIDYVCTPIGPVPCPSDIKWSWFIHVSFRVPSADGKDLIGMVAEFYWRDGYIVTVKVY